MADLSGIEGVVIFSPHYPVLIRVAFGEDGKSDYRDLNPDQLTKIDKKQPRKGDFNGAPTNGDELDDFIQEIKNEFKDENWDYLTFVAERVRRKRITPTPTSKEGLEDGGFTPGEWGAYYNSEEFPGQAAIYGCDGDTNGRVIAVLDTSDQTDMANIDLICAAPAMYEALKKTLAAMTDLVRQLPTDERLADYNLDFCESAEQEAKAILTRINKQ